MNKEKNRREAPKSKLPLFFFIVILIVVTLTIVDYKRSVHTPNSIDGQKVRIEIVEGESVNNILDLLLKGNLLTKKNYYYTKAYLKINKLGTNLQAGVYQLPRNLTIMELINTLQYGRSEEVWVTIPEGLRKDEIAEIVAGELEGYDSTNFYTEEFLALTTDTEFISQLELIEEVENLEGFLFPDKYSFPKEVSTREVITEMVENFKRKVGQEYTYQDIIFASIVEREGYNANDRPIIAGIILKRFEEGWLLQTDATLLYPVKNWKHTITKEDKNSDNPYNTYRRIGLPPTPICNPGIQAIDAVWNPTETNYYYYIHDKEKNPHYAKTLEEHNMNVNKYLR